MDEDVLVRPVLWEIHQSCHPSSSSLASFPRALREKLDSWLWLGWGLDAVLNPSRATTLFSFSRSFCQIWAAERPEATGSSVRLCLVAVLGEADAMVVASTRGRSPLTTLRCSPLQTALYRVSNASGRSDAFHVSGWDIMALQ